MGKETRRELFDNLGKLSLLPFVQELGRFLPNLEAERNPLIPGNVVRDEQGKRYVIKEELDDRGNKVLRRYRIESFGYWGVNVGHIRNQHPRNEYYARTSELSRIPITKVPQDDTVDFWDGSKKVHNSEGGTKFVFIAGLGSQSGNRNFDTLKNRLRELEYDERDFLDATYRIDFRKKTLGVPFTTIDSTKDPMKTLEVMDQLMYLWKKQFPLEKFWLIGHSQGGWLAYELARRHPDAAIGVISLSGALKGARLTPLPTPIESTTAYVLKGEGGKFFIDRGANPSTSQFVEEEVKKIQEQKILFLPYASTDDWVTEEKFSYVENARQELFGRKLSLRIPMGSWVEAEEVQDAVQQATCIDASCLEPDFTNPIIADPSARLRVAEYLGSHWAVFKHPKVLDDIIYVVANASRSPNERRWDEETRRDIEAHGRFIMENEEWSRNNYPDMFLWNNVQNNRPKTDDFAIIHISSRPGYLFIVTLKEADPHRSREAAISWFRSLGLSDQQIQSLPISYQPEAVVKLKEEELPYYGTSFSIGYDKSFDATKVVIYLRAREAGEQEFDAFLKENGISDRSLINNLTILYR